MVNYICTRARPVLFFFHVVPSLRYTEIHNHAFAEMQAGLGHFVKEAAAMQLLRKKGMLDSTRVLFLPLASISPNPNQPRKHFSQEELEELADSIRTLGLLQPLTVRRRNGSWELIAGERRLRAAKLAGLEEVPCLSIQADSQSSSLLALVENLQRRDLDFWEEALALRRLIDVYHLSQEDAARRIGKSQSAVANKLRLLKLPPQVLSVLREGGLLRAPCPGPSAAGPSRGSGGDCPPGGGAAADGGPDRGTGRAGFGAACSEKASAAYLSCKGCALLFEYAYPGAGPDALRRGGRPIPPRGHGQRNSSYHSYPPPGRVLTLFHTPHL